jgi:hypothetical protein
MKVLIKQPAGLGDIFFAQKIAWHFGHHLNAQVIWPILPHFMFLADYLRPIQETKFVSVDEQFPGKDLYESNFGATIANDHYQVLNLHGHSDDEGVMKVKYRIFGVGFEDWLKYFNFTRNYEREAKLLDALKILPGEKFILANHYFASLPATLQAPFMVSGNARIVEMHPIFWTNLFDWCGVIERAAEIHTVETSICYLIEKLQTTSNLFLYARNCAPDWTYVNGIYSKPWNYQK